MFILFGHRMAHFSATSAMAGSSDTTRFGSLEFPALPPVGMWVSPVFEPSQTFLFGSLDFVADQLGMLRLREEALVSTLVGGGAPSVGAGPPDDLNNEAPALCSDPMLGSNPTVSNVHIILYSLFNIFRRLSGGTPLSPLQPPCDRFSYGLASPRGCVRTGAPKDADAAPSDIRIHGDGRLRSCLFP